jgi:hypothetical protein
VKERVLHHLHACPNFSERCGTTAGGQKNRIAGVRNPLLQTWRAIFKRPAPPLEYRSTLPPMKPHPKRRKTDKWPLV